MLFCNLTNPNLTLKIRIILILLLQNVLCLATGFENEAMFRKHSEAIIKALADEYQPPSLNIGDPQKYYWPKVMARFEKYGTQDSLANDWIKILASRDPFHFTLVGMVRILNLYPNAPSVKNFRQEFLKRVFDRKDRYNSWTSEGTENHINMSRTSGYLYAQLAEENAYRVEEARKHMANMRKWILNWSKALYQNGNGEWNSSIYGMYNLIGWLNLYDFAKDKEVKNAAKAVCDFYATEFALFYSFGAIGGSEMRGNGIGSGAGSSSAFCAQLWFSPEPMYKIGGHKEYIQSIHAVTSSYRPPNLLIGLARKESDFQGIYKISRPGYLLAPRSFVRQTFSIGQGFTLGSSLSNYGGWSGSTSQIVPWKLVIDNGFEKDPFEMAGNGMFYSNRNGKIRDPFTQIVQFDNILIQMSILPSDYKIIDKNISDIIQEWKKKWADDFLKRFPDLKEFHNVVNKTKTGKSNPGSYLSFNEDVMINIENQFGFIEKQNTFIGIKTISGKPIQIDKKNTKYKDLKVILDNTSVDSLGGFIVLVDNKENYKNYIQFKESFKSLNIRKTDKSIRLLNIKGESLEAVFQTDGKFEEAIVDWGFGTDKQHFSITTPPYVQPLWPSGAGHGKMPKAFCNGNDMLSKLEWPEYESKALSLRNGILEINRNGSSYKVDYSGDFPKFMELVP